MQDLYLIAQAKDKLIEKLQEEVRQQRQEIIELNKKLAVAYLTIDIFNENGVHKDQMTLGVMK
jgi:hypothetical protein